MVAYINNCNIHLTSGNQGYILVRCRLNFTCQNYVGRVSDLLSGKSMFIAMHDINSPMNQHSALQCTQAYYIHVEDDVAQT